MPPANSTFSDGATSDDLGGDYDVISDAGGAGPPSESLDSSIAELDIERDLEYVANFGVTSVAGLGGGDGYGVGEGEGGGGGVGLVGVGVEVQVWEPKPTREAMVMFETAALGAGDVQAYVKRTTDKGFGSGTASAAGTMRRGAGGREKPVRVYVDGVFDFLHVGTMLRLRQAKLSFPNVHLIVGVFSDEQIRIHSSGARSSSSTPVPLVPHIERCELVRHIRWVDEVLPYAPFAINDTFLARSKIDFVAVEEGSSVDPMVEKVRVGGYDLVKTMGKSIPTRRTRNVAAQSFMLATHPSPQASPSPPDTLSHITQAQARTPKQPIGELSQLEPNAPHSSRPQPVPKLTPSHSASPRTNANAFPSVDAAFSPPAPAPAPAPDPPTHAQDSPTPDESRRRSEEQQERMRAQARHVMVEKERRRLTLERQRALRQAALRDGGDDADDETPEPKDAFGLGI